MPFCRATLHGARGEEWERIAGTRSFPVRGFLPVLARLPGFSEPQRVYLLDIPKLQPEVFERIVVHLVAKFDLTAEEARLELEKTGIPILAEDCSVATDLRYFL